MNKKISELERLPKISGSEEIPVAVNGENYKITPAQITEEIENAQAEDLAKITELQGKLNGVDVQKMSKDLDTLEFTVETLNGGIGEIENLIPNQASTDNQLADKNFVNSSIATNTAEFKGTYESLDELQNITADANDYGFVKTVDSDGNTVFNRYKYVDGTEWVFEYALNNSSFTASQWASVNSNITPKLVDKLTELPNAEEIDESYVKKSGDTITGPLTANDSIISKTNMQIAGTKDAKIILNNTDQETNLQYISFRQNDVEYAVLGVNQIDSTRLTWNGSQGFRTSIFHSTANTGTSPLNVASTTVCQNLNADMLDGCHAGVVPGNVFKHVEFPTHIRLVQLGYNTSDLQTNTEAYFKGICKWAIDNYRNNEEGNILLGDAQPNAHGFFHLQLYGTDAKDTTTGLPRYCRGVWYALGGYTIDFHCNNYIWSYREIPNNF